MLYHAAAHGPSSVRPKPGLGSTSMSKARTGRGQVDAELAGAESLDATEGHADFADAELLDVERMELADAEPSTSTMCFDGLQVGEERLDKSCSTVTAPKPSGVCLSMFSTARSVYMDLRVEVLQLSDGLEDNERVPVEVLHGPERVGVDLRFEVLPRGDGLEDNERVPVEVLHGPGRVGIDLRIEVLQHMDGLEDIRQVPVEVLHGPSVLA